MNSSFFSAGFVASATTGVALATAAFPLSNAFSAASPAFFAHLLSLSANLSNVPFSAAFAIAEAHPTPIIHINVFQNQNFHIDAITSPITPIAPNAHPDLVASERIVDQVEAVSDATFHTTAPIHPATAPTHSPTTQAALPAVVLGRCDDVLVTGNVPGFTAGATVVAIFSAIAGFESMN